MRIFKKGVAVASFGLLSILSASAYASAQDICVVTSGMCGPYTLSGSQSLPVALTGFAANKTYQCRFTGNGVKSISITNIQSLPPLKTIAYLTKPNADSLYRNSLMVQTKSDTSWVSANYNNKEIVSNSTFSITCTSQ